MKKISLIATAFVVCFLFAPLVSAQSVIRGYASCSYDYDTHLVTGVVTTELSYSAQDWYQGMVAGSLYTDENVLLANGSLKDLDRDGTVSKTMQATDNSSLGYTAKGTNVAIADIQDYAIGTYYIDYWNFQAVMIERVCTTTSICRITDMALEKTAPGATLRSVPRWPRPTEWD